MADRPHNLSTHPPHRSDASSSQAYRNASASRDDGAETIFDFSLPDRSAQEVTDLRRRAEYLLDEMEMGGADRSAWMGDDQAESSYTGNGNGHSRPGRFENSAPPEPQSQVVPETVLPSIKSRPPALSYPPQESILTPPPQRRESKAFTSRRMTALSVPTVSSVDPHRAQELESEIAQLYEQVSRLQQNRRDLTGHALSLLREARTIIHSQPERLGRAEYNIRQVHSILQRNREGHRRSTRNGILLLLYLSLWLMLCSAGVVALVLYQNELSTLITANQATNPALARHLLPLLWTVLLGGTGGVIGAIFSLVVLMRNGQEFDQQYVVRYIIQPVMGVVLAFSVYGMALVFFSLIEIDLLAQPLTQWVPAAVAFPVGLWQEGVYGMLYRFSRIFRFGRRR